jgi:RHS repeat-associated protein
VGDATGRDMTADGYYSVWGGKYAGGTLNAASFGADRSSSASMKQLSFFRNRFYDQQSGRWTQEDPIGVAGGVNLYQFNGNNPVSNTDPFGLCFGPLIVICPAMIEGAMYAIGGVIALAAINDISNKVGEGSAGGPSAGRRATPGEREDALDAARDPDGVVRCTYCDKELTPEPGKPNSETIDHVKPRNPKAGRPRGNNEPENLKPACPGCNSSKGNREYPNEWRPRTEP